ncbi:MAG TPA: methylated-DNA--[protein]-cysteine S-methyltransferase [Bacteroidia bacterium]|nr:methylated-DNA--[protein]-cysteine S-methyltransferase [Bacteroidia bacterium]
MNSTACVSSALGWLEIGSTGAAISKLSMLDQRPVHSMQKEPTPVIKACLEELHAFFEGSLTQFSVPVVQEGTAFQQKVWAELLKIPFGETISYLELSRRIGDEKAIRAVGTSNGKNQIAIIVPCHRVIGSNGTLTGYAGGLWRKQWLLEHEMKIKHGVRMLF